MNDDTKLNTDDDTVIASETKQSSTEEEIATDSTSPRNDENKLPVEEAGQLEEPEETQKKLDVRGEKIDEEVGDLKLDSQNTQDPTSNFEPQDPSSNIQHPISSPDTPTVLPAGRQDQPTDTPNTDIPSQDTPGRWYVVHTYSGHENKVATTLKQRIESEHLKEKIFEVLVPTQDKIEIRGGKKASIKEKIFPGYILVKMILDDISWLAVRTTQGVTSFVGMGNKPTPISNEEVKTIVRFTQIAEPTFKQIFIANDTVKIVDGPFAEFIGKVDSVDEEKGKVRVLVSIFGRETPVELDFLQVQKI